MVATAIRGRLDGNYRVDPWGLDRQVVVALGPLVRIRYRVDCDGLEHLPLEGPALVVVNRRFGVSEPVVVAHGCARRRIVRPASLVDLPGTEWPMRRTGFVLADPHEITSLLRAEEAVVVFADAMPRRPSRVGRVRADLLAPAVDSGVPIIPAAVWGEEWTRHWQLQVGPAVALRRHAKGPLAAAEAADQARAAVQELLDEAHPPRWLLRG